MQKTLELVSEFFVIWYYLRPSEKVTAKGFPGFLVHMKTSPAADSNLFYSRY